MASTCFQHKSSEDGVQSSRGLSPEDVSDDDLPSFSEILKEVRQRPQEPVIDLILEGDSDDGKPLPASSSHEPTQSTQESLSSCSAAASQAMKGHPIKNRPPWSPFLRKHGTLLEPPPSETSRNALHAESLIVSEPAPEHAKGLIGQSGGSLEILETPTEDNCSDDGSGLLFLNVDGTEPSICETAQECDTGPIRAAKRQRMDETDTVPDTSYSHNSPIFVAECCGQTLTSGSPSSPPSCVDDKTLARAIISTFKIAKITGQRLGPDRFECEFEPLWLPADVVKMASMGCVHIQRYENEIDLRTSRGRKRTRS